MVTLGELMRIEGDGIDVATLWPLEYEEGAPQGCPDDELVVPLKATQTRSGAGEVFYRCFVFGRAYLINERYLKPL